MTLTQMNAPVPAATGNEGEDQNLGRGPVMGQSNREARAAAANEGSIAADARIAIEDRPQKRILQSDAETAERYQDLGNLFSAEELETMPLHIFDSRSQQPVKVWRGSDGGWYRCGANVRIAPAKGGGSRFVIILLVGANRDDLEHALNVVARTRAGAESRNVSWSKRGKDWADWADDRTFIYEFTSRRYADPYTHEDHSPSVAACADPSCSERWHETELGVHKIDRIGRQLAGGSGAYEIAVTRALTEEHWTVDVFADDFYGTPADVASFVSDLQWMQEECRRANERLVQSKAVAA